MKYILLPIFLFGSFMCKAQTQAEMNAEAYNEFKHAKDSLDVINYKICANSTDSNFIKSVNNVQQKWIEYRDAQIDMLFPNGTEYGSILPVCIYMYATELTYSRIEMVRLWLDGFEEVEGDMCAGSLPIKIKTTK